MHTKKSIGGMEI